MWTEFNNAFTAVLNIKVTWIKGTAFLTWVTSVVRLVCKISNFSPILPRITYRAKSDRRTGIAGWGVWRDCRSLVPRHRVHSGRWWCTVNNWRREPAYSSSTSNSSENYYQKNNRECTMDQEPQRIQQANDVIRTRRASGQPADAAGRTSWTPSWKCDIISKIRRCQSMQIILLNFILIRFETMEPLTFFEVCRPNNKNNNKNKMSSDTGSCISWSKK